jgi:hypothetical protein
VSASKNGDSPAGVMTLGKVYCYWARMQWLNRDELTHRVDMKGCGFNYLRCGMRHDNGHSSSDLMTGFKGRCHLIVFRRVCLTTT